MGSGKCFKEKNLTIYDRTGKIKTGIEVKVEEWS